MHQLVIKFLEWHTKLSFFVLTLHLKDIPRLPSEWDSWLRHRRAHPPTLEEIARNEEAAQMRAQNGQEIEVSFIRAFISTLATNMGLLINRIVCFEPF